MTQPATSGNLLTGTLAALGGALVGAVLWAVIATTTDYKIGWAAVGVGAASGFLAGKVGGAHPRLPVVAGAVGLLGCVLGDLLIDAHGVSVALAKVDGVHLSLFRVLREMAQHPSGLGWPAYKAGFAPLDALFYGFAALTGFRLATRHGAQPVPVHVPPVLPEAPPVAEPGPTL